MRATPLKAIIVDDDESGRENLQALLHEYCLDVAIVGFAASVDEAVTLIRAAAPDVVFLDVHMPGKDGFALLSMLPEELAPPHIVFVTAYDQYAISAIRKKAFDYLLKPIDVDELQDCIQRLLVAQSAQQPANTERTDERISVGHAKGTRLISLKDIVYLEGDRNYTIMHLLTEKGAEKFIVSRTMSDFEATLPGSRFFRVHKSYIINVAHLREQLNYKGGNIVMSNGRQIEVSRRRSSLFHEFINAHYSKPAKR